MLFGENNILIQSNQMMRSIITSSHGLDLSDFICLPQIAKKKVILTRERVIHEDFFSLFTEDFRRVVEKEKKK